MEAPSSGHSIIIPFKRGFLLLLLGAVPPGVIPGRIPGLIGGSIYDRHKKVSDLISSSQSHFIFR